MRPGRACASSGGCATGRGARDRARRVRRTRRLRALRRVGSRRHAARRGARARRDRARGRRLRRERGCDGRRPRRERAPLGALRQRVGRAPAGQSVRPPRHDHARGRPRGRRSPAAARSAAPRSRARRPVRLVLRFRVPDGTAAGSYDGRLVFAQNGQPFETLPVRLRVFAVRLPARDDRTAFRTLFLIQPQTYLEAVAAHSRVAPETVGPGVTDRLYAFLSDYRLSPGDWGSGTPWPDGYAERPGLVAGFGDAHVRRGQVSVPHDAATARHAAIGARRAPGRRPARPATWTAYLTDRVLPFWREHGWLDRALVWGWDEPGPVYGRQFAAPQACAAHAAGVAYLTTGAPSRRIPARRVTIPWGQGTRSFTIRAPRRGQRLPVGRPGLRRRRHLGRALAPLLRLLRHARSSRRRTSTSQRELQGAIRTARARGASIWSFTYESQVAPRVAGLRRDGATDRCARVRSLERARGPGRDALCRWHGELRRRVDPYRRLAQHGQHVLLYPALSQHR